MVSNRTETKLKRGQTQYLSALASVGGFQRRLSMHGEQSSEQDVAGHPGDTALGHRPSHVPRLDSRDAAAAAIQRRYRQQQDRQRTTAARRPPTV